MGERVEVRGTHIKDPHPPTPSARVPPSPAVRERGLPSRLYRTGEKDAGISSLFSCRIGLTPACGGHGRPGAREASRMRARSFTSLYTQMWVNLLSPPSSLVPLAATGAR